MRGGRHHPRRGGHGRGRPVVVVQPKPAVVAKVGPVAVVVKPKPVVKVVHPPHRRHHPHPHPKPVVVVKPHPKPVAVVAAATFQREHKYLFAQSNLVLIRLSNGQQLRVHPQNGQQVDAHGAKGVLARWHAEVYAGGIIKFRNRSSGKYLRMRSDGAIDANGVGGAWCEWRVMKQGAGTGHAKLQSKAHGKYLAFRNGRLVAGTGGPFCKLTFIRKD